MYRCPLCLQRLEFFELTYNCDNNHSFDRAKLGYVNLLPVQNKNSKQPGDNKQMLSARRRFLEGGYYQKLSDQIIAVIKNKGFENKLSEENNRYACLDLGCGEGYYLERLLAQLPFIGYGIDISKEGVILASKKRNLNKSAIEYAVASCSNLPFVNDCFDLVIRIFSPSEPTEIMRVLNNNGLLVTVSPGERHHFQLKEIIYETPITHQQEDQINGFNLIHTESLAYLLELVDGNVIADFLAMTPYGWKLTETQKQQLIQSPLTCELDFKINIYQVNT